jgi:hypothetical protein
MSLLLLTFYCLGENHRRCKGIQFFFNSHWYLQTTTPLQPCPSLLALISCLYAVQSIVQSTVDQLWALTVDSFIQHVIGKFCRHTAWIVSTLKQKKNCCTVLESSFRTHVTDAVKIIKLLTIKRPLLNITHIGENFDTELHYFSNVFSRRWATVLWVLLL